MRTSRATTPGTATSCWVTRTAGSSTCTRSRSTTRATNVFGVEYPLESLSGTGSIGGRAVHCIAADWMMRFHTGYPLDEGDLHDVLVLHERFGLAIPADYEELLRSAGGSPGAS